MDNKYLPPLLAELRQKQKEVESLALAVHLKLKERNIILSQTAVLALCALGETDPWPLSALAKSLDLTHPAIKHGLAPLYKHKYAQCFKLPEDRRLTLWQLTDAGKQLRKDVMAILCL